MSKSMKMLLAGAAIMALTASAYAHDGDECAYEGHHGWHHMSQERMEKMHEKHMARLHDALKLSAQQEPAWNKFAAQPPMMDKGEHTGMDKLNAPQRMEEGLDHLRKMEARMSDRLAALKEFYATLTPEQQKTFDAHMFHFRQHDRHGHHEHMQSMPQSAQPAATPDSK